MAKLKFNVKDVLPQLLQVASVVVQKNTMPILDCIKLETTKVNGNVALRLTASDGETWVSTIASIQADDDICCCILANDIIKGLSNLDDVDVEMSFDDEKKNVTCNYGNGFFVITYEDASTFPTNKVDFSGACEHEINSKALLSYISMVSFATNPYELRPVLNSVHFDFFKDKMVVVATDGQRLAKITDYGISQNNEETNSLSLPTKPAQILTKILSTIDDVVKCKFNDKSVVFYCDSFYLLARLVEGRYPNYEMVIPTTFNHIALVDKSSILPAIKRVTPMGDANSELIQLKFEDGNIMLKTENIEFSKKAEENVKCQYKDTPLTIGFKSTYLVQSINSIDCKTIRIKMVAQDRACVIEPEANTSEVEHTRLVMPLRIEE